MLKDEQLAGSAHEGSGPMTYGDYLRVPELLALQTPLGGPDAPDEMIFIILQQAQELWFKEILFELRRVISALGAGRLIEAARLMDRINRIFRVLGDEVAVMETMPPQEFLRFRNVLTSSSGLESQQFREVEIACGLDDPSFLKLVGHFMNVDEIKADWRVTLHDAFLGQLRAVNADPAEAVAIIYLNADRYPELFLVAEALSEYEVLFSEWRFHHLKLVERTIGAQSSGTAGSTGAGYLGKTVTYRFFPELWTGRNLMTARAQK